MSKVLTANGAELLASFATPAARATRPGAVILARTTAGELVTAWLGEGDSSWSWGHYFAPDALTEARADYALRTSRGY